MDGKLLARLGAIIFVAIAITATVIEMSRQDQTAPDRMVPRPRQPSDELSQSLRNCQQLGEAAVSNPGCLATWAESRDRFLGRTPAPLPPRPVEGE
ncbi:hypothetical protein S2M10_33130 [Sphingomonas sp. S2M10]|uniref:putative entry exclusion protein TrbK-alt n=1 Tax=Sphingomonas sp. S2M10 TaxID=2705010 RepID=UPI0014578F80|nr:putative entry exclusion protein TrbK-alt [Sphingomonas sp. S2M10]NLS28303.1 hypothetical protein [Sphingomonas sp. S2M10]